MHSSASKTLRLINKCFWMSGAEDLYKTSFRESARLKHCVNSERGYQSVPVHISLSRTQVANPMLNGVPMLQWFFDEVRPDQREVRYWMKYFSQATNSQQTFAVIQISEDVFIKEEQDQLAKTEDAVKRSILETLSLSLYFLQQNKMNVIVLIGSSLNQATTTEQGEGQQDAKEVRQRIARHIRTIVDRLEKSGTRSFPVFDGGQIFNADSSNRITSLNKANLDWLAGHDKIPVIGCVGEDNYGRLIPISIDEGVHLVSDYTKPLKVLLLNSEGGVTDHEGRRVTTVFLPGKTEVAKFKDQLWWNKELETKFVKICDLLKVLPKKSSYVITSAGDLLSELLTQRGVGTIFKKVVPVTKYKNLNDYLLINGEKKKIGEILPELMNSAFDKRTTSAYWESLSDRLEAIYLTDDIKACAIVMKSLTDPSVFYLDKFAVCKEERGNFNVDVLWQQLKHDYKSLFWRSRHNNLFNSWYEARCDGIIKLGLYHVFWYGMTGSHISSIITEIQDLPSSFMLPG